MTSRSSMVVHMHVADAAEVSAEVRQDIHQSDPYVVVRIERPSGADVSCTLFVHDPGVLARLAESLMEAEYELRNRLPKPTPITAALEAA